MNDELMTSDVVIIGAGIIGCAVAYEAAKRGLSVAVLERGEPGSGASGVGGGFISASTKKPGPHRELALASAKLYEILEADLEVPQGSLGYRQRGLLILAESEDDLLHLNRWIEASHVDDEYEILSSAEVQRMEPGLASSVAGGVFCPNHADVLPVEVLKAYRQAAERLGVKFSTHSPIIAAERRGESWRIQTHHQDGEAEKVVIAAGAWSGEVGAFFGVTVPVRPRRGQALLFPQASFLLQHPVLSAGYFAAKHHSTNHADIENVIQLSLWPRSDGALFVGGTREWAGFRAEPDEGTLNHLRKRAEAVLPDVASLPAGEPIVGFRPYSETGLPLIGPVPQLPSLLLATGHEGDGISLAPITGRLVAQSLIQETTELELTSFLLPR